VTDFEIVRVAAADIDDAMPLLRGYCEFYDAAPSESALRGLCEALVADPEHAGIQLLARLPDGTAVGLATLLWTFATLNAGPIGLMNDLYVAPAARGLGIGTALIEACAGESVHHGATGLEWYTAPSNARAQAVYDRTGATREEWISYSLSVS
jgi:ribosomal protein S18 acetylase RimI-like enzyme